MENNQVSSSSTSRNNEKNDLLGKENKELQAMLNVWQEEAKILQTIAIDDAISIGESILKIENQKKIIDELHLKIALNEKRAIMEAKEKETSRTNELKVLYGKIQQTEETLTSTKQEYDRLLLAKQNLDSLLDSSLQRNINDEKKIAEYKIQIKNHDLVYNEIHDKYMQVSEKANSMEAGLSKLKIMNACKEKDFQIQLQKSNRNLKLMQEELTNSEQNSLVLKEKVNTLEEQLLKPTCVHHPKYKEKIRKLREKLRVGDQNLEKRNVDLESLEKKIQEMEEKNSQLSEQKKRLDNYIAVLEDKNIELEAKKEEKERELRDFKLKPYIDKRPNFKAKQTKDQLAQILQELEQTKRALELSETGKQEAEHKNLQFSVNQKKMEECKAALTEQVVKLKADIDLSRLAVQEKNSKLDVLEKQYQELQARHKQDTEAIQNSGNLQKQLDECTLNLNKLKSDLQIQVEKVKTIEEEYFKLSTEKEKKEVSFTSLTNNYLELQKILKNTEKELKEKIAEFEEHRQNQLKICKAGQEKLERDLELSNKKVAQSEEEKIKLFSKQKELEILLVDVSSNIIKLKTALKNSKAVIEGIKHYISTSTEENKTLVKKLQECLSREGRLKNELQQLCNKKSTEEDVKLQNCENFQDFKCKEDFNVDATTQTEQLNADVAEVLEDKINIETSAVYPNSDPDKKDLNMRVNNPTGSFPWDFM